MCNRLGTIPVCDRQTDRETDRQTDILPRHSPRYAYASRVKIAILTYPGLHFLFALWQSRKTLHEWKDNSVLAKPLAARTIYLQQFPSYSNRKCKKSPFSRTAAPIFVSPGHAPGAITLNVVWMEREFDAYKLSRSMYPSIFTSFPVIRTASAKKNRRFHVQQPTFLFPLETPLRLSRNMLHGWKDNSMLIAKPLAACTYLYFNSFIVSELYDA